MATWIVVLYAGAGAAGCAQPTRYQVLTFFFTGVPPPEGEVAAGTVQTPAATPAAPRKKRREFFLPAHFFVHGPFGAGECGQCHAMTASKPFRSGQADTGQATDSEQMNIGPRLAVPLENLCVGCHADKGQVAAASQNLWSHGPAANGWCTACHSPHKAARRYMLLKNDSVELCTGCHRADDLLLTAAHAEDPKADCMSCHNPHMSKTAFLLRSDHDEWSEYGRRE